MEKRIDLDARRTTVFLLRIVGALLALHLLVVFFHLVLGWRVGAFTALFDMALESNVPAYFNSLLFVLLALLCLLARGSDGAPMRRGWLLLAIVFGFLAIDEGSQIHERFGHFTWVLLTHGDATVDLGIFYYAWVIPYGALALLFALVMGRFLLKLPARSRWGLVLAGGIYVCGAVLIEMISGKVGRPVEGAPSPASLAVLPCDVYPYGECNLHGLPLYVLLYTIEECLEMCGLIAAASVVLRHVRATGAAITFAVPKAEQRG